MPTFIARRKRVRILYVVLLCIAIAMSTWAVYNQVHSDSTAAQFADQITAFCTENPAYVTDHLNCQQAKDVQDKGAPTIEGPKGDKGDKGDTGEQGDPGIAGPKGDSIMGPPGVDGNDGTNGANGNDGENGVDGQNGQPGDKGDKGDKGDTGAQGERGADGQPGEDAPRITNMTFEGTALACNLVVTFDKGGPQTITVPGALCVS